MAMVSPKAPGNGARADEPCAVLTTAGGRRLAWSEYGLPGGRPVVYCHGFPASRLEAAILAEAAERTGIRLIAPDRPGYGRSDPRPGHSLLDGAEDLRGVADARGIERFHVLGVSGGGPYALAAGQRLAPRLTGVTLVGALGPLEGADALQEFRGAGRLFLTVARRLPGLLPPLAGLVTLLVRAGRPDLVLRLLAGDPPPADRRALADPRFRPAAVAAFAEAFRQGSAAAVAELRRYVSPWGFDPEAVAAPVSLWHGTADRTVPVAIGRRLAQSLPRCRSRFLEGEGHFSLPCYHGEEILETLAEPETRP